MNTKLINVDIQNFINANLNADLSKLALQKNPFLDVDFKEIINQIAAKSKAKTKLPTWFSNEKILYPSKISVEQTSSEKTAAYKSSLISGGTLIDLTGGFGVDDYFFSKQFAKVFHCEIDDDLSELVKYNFQRLGVENVICIAGDGTEILKNSDRKFDWMYIDPSRRNDSKGKVFLLKDCLPNVPALIDLYFTYSENILIKTAPILDISAGLDELKFVAKIHIIAVNNEVKELLWELRTGFKKPIIISAVNIVEDELSIFEYVLNDNRIPEFALPNKYLYEPNSAIMKSAGFNAVGLKFGLKKLHTHSHLYTSDTHISFPGRSFEIQSQHSYNKVEMKKCFENTKANITTRNFPDSVENIRKKWKIKDGGDRYCFFTTDMNDNKIVLICSKI